MKTLILLSILFSSLPLFAQWQPINAVGTDVGNIFHLNGTVGIGTNAPVGKLHVEGTGEWQLLLKDKGTGGLDWRVGSSANSWAAGGGKFLISNSNSSAAAVFVITPQNNIGVGTLYPTAKFEVTGGIKISDFAGGGHNIIVNNGYGGSFNTTEEFSYIAKFRGNTVSSAYDALVITGGTNGGKVGIGTVAPTSKLEVMGGIKISDFAGGGHNIIVNNGYGGSFNTTEEFSYIAKFRGHTIGGAYDALVITGGHDGGRVGIGTKDPDAKLAVKGKIHAEEVLVDLNVRGPDYVFEKDYNLLPLAEVENYIIQNKHLPEVPAAKEMKKNGVNLGEMNMLLLKKVEELTLYVIELKKENEEQRKRNEYQQLEIESIKLKMK
jgi:hypothetical protein